MSYDFDNIVLQWYEELKLPFINYIHTNFSLSYDDTMDLYNDAWMAVRDIIMEGRASGSNWRSLILTIGRRQAEKVAKRRLFIVSLYSFGDDEEEKFNRGLFEAEKAKAAMDATTVYEDPELRAILGQELNYIPEPCNKVLQFYYYQEMSMTEIAEAMNYSSSRSAITIKNRCMDKLRMRIKKAARNIGLVS